MRPPPPPHPGVLQLRGQECGRGPRLCEARPSPGGLGLPPRPDPTRPGSAPFPLQLRTCSCARRRGCHRRLRLRPRRSRPALRPPPPAPAPQADRPRRSCSAGPAPRLPPALPPPSTGSRDGDRSCAANTHPQPGILPTSTIAREVRGDERRLSRDPSPWQRLQQKQPGLRLRLRLGGGRCGGRRTKARMARG